jgi:hypothetical protein
MARRAVNNGFAYEQVGMTPGDDTEVRRQIFVGQIVPDHYRVENEGDVVEEELPVFGLGAAPQEYKHALGKGASSRAGGATGKAAAKS